MPLPRSASHGGHTRFGAWKGWLLTHDISRSDSNAQATKTQLRSRKLPSHPVNIERESQSATEWRVSNTKARERTQRKEREGGRGRLEERIGCVIVCAGVRFRLGCGLAKAPAWRFHTHQESCVGEEGRWIFQRSQVATPKPLLATPEPAPAPLLLRPASLATVSALQSS